VPPFSPPPALAVKSRTPLVSPVDLPLPNPGATTLISAGFFFALLDVVLPLFRIQRTPVLPPPPPPLRPTRRSLYSLPPFVFFSPLIFFFSLNRGAFGRSRPDPPLPPDDSRFPRPLFFFFNFFPFPPIRLTSPLRCFFHASSLVACFFSCPAEGVFYYRVFPLTPYVFPGFWI